jgi:hypothetical protein
MFALEQHQQTETRVSWDRLKDRDDFQRGADPAVTAGTNETL